MTIYYRGVEIKPSLAVITASDATRAVLHDLPAPGGLCDNSSILQLSAFLSTTTFPDGICQPSSLISTGLHLTNCHVPTTLGQGRKMAFQCWHPVCFFWLRTEWGLLAGADIPGQVSSIHWNRSSFQVFWMFKEQKETFLLCSSFPSTNNLSFKAINSTETYLCTKEGVV